MPEPSLDDVVSMAIFAAVVESRSFTAAGRRVGLAKSAVSARIASLERRLGARLLHRTTRKLSLTHDGAQVYARCTRIVAAAGEAVEVAVRSGSAPRGTLRVNAPTAFSERFLVEPIASFLARYPEVRIELQLTERRIDPLDQSVDVTIRTTKRLRDSSLIVRKLAAMPIVVCAAPSYLEARGIPETPADLASHNCLGFSLLTAREQWSFRVRGRLQTVPVIGNLSVDSGGMLVALSVAGAGILGVPWCFVADHVRAGRLSTVLDEFRAHDVAVYALYPHARLVPPKVRAFVDHLTAWFQSPRWKSIAQRQ